MRSFVRGLITAAHRTRVGRHLSRKKEDSKRKNSKQQNEIILSLSIYYTIENGGCSRVNILGQFTAHIRNEITENTVE